MQVNVQIQQVPSDSAWLTRQAGWQRQVADLCRAAPGTLAHRHLRRRLDRWQAATLPGHRVPRVLDRLQRLASCCTHRVLAAYLRLVCNGLCTYRRFQSRGGCRFGCGDRADSIEHFAFCRVLRLFFQRAGVISEPPAPAQALDLLLGLEGPDNLIQVHGQAIYALSVVHNARRHGSISTEQVADALDAAFQMACR